MTNVYDGVYSKGLSRVACKSEEMSAYRGRDTPRDFGLVKTLPEQFQCIAILASNPTTLSTYLLAELN